MIRHVVLFKFKEDVDEARRKILITALSALREKISLVKELEVGVDTGHKHNSYDIVLNSLFNTFDDVEAYAVHPEHLKVVELVKEMCLSSVKVDFDTDRAC